MTLEHLPGHPRTHQDLPSPPGPSRASNDSPGPSRTPQDPRTPRTQPFSSLGPLIFALHSAPRLAHPSAVPSSQARSVLAPPSAWGPPGLVSTGSLPRAHFPASPCVTTGSEEEHPVLITFCRPRAWLLRGGPLVPPGPRAAAAAGVEWVLVPEWGRRNASPERGLWGHPAGRVRRSLVPVRGLRKLDRAVDRTPSASLCPALGVSSPSTAVDEVVGPGVEEGPWTEAWPPFPGTQGGPSSHAGQGGRLRASGGSAGPWGREAMSPRPRRRHTCHGRISAAPGEGLLGKSSWGSLTRREDAERSARPPEALKTTVHFPCPGLPCVARSLISSNNASSSHIRSSPARGYQSPERCWWLRVNGDPAGCNWRRVTFIHGLKSENGLLCILIIGKHLPPSL